MGSNFMDAEPRIRVLAAAYRQGLRVGGRRPPALTAVHGSPRADRASVTEIISVSETCDGAPATGPER